MAGSLPPLGESYSTAGGQRAAELAQPVYTQVISVSSVGDSCIAGCKTLKKTTPSWLTSCHCRSLHKSLSGLA